MCKISTETIKRANKRMMERKMEIQTPSSVTSMGINISIQYNGKSFEQRISFEKIREAYGQALKNAIPDVKKL